MARKKTKGEQMISVNINLPNPPDPEDDDDDERAPVLGTLATNTNTVNTYTSNIITNRASDLKENLLERKFHAAYDEISDAFLLRFDCNLGSPAALAADLDEEMAQQWASKTKSAEVMDGDDRWRPDVEECAMISAMAGVPIKRNDVRRYFAFVADKGPFTNGDKLHTRAHEQIAEMDKGNPWIKNHDEWSVDAVVGRIFDSGVMRGSKGTRNWQKYYGVDIPEFQAFYSQIEHGINTNLSISFMTMRHDYICDTCKKPMFSRNWQECCGHWPGQRLDNGTTNTQTVMNIFRYRETSSVVKGNVQTASFKHNHSDRVIVPVTVNQFREVVGLKPLVDDTHTTIQQVHSTGETTVPNEDTPKPAAEEQQTNAEPQAAAPAEGAAPVQLQNADPDPPAPPDPVETKYALQPEVQKQFSDLVEVAIKPHTDQLNSVISQFTAGVEKLALLNTELSKAAADKTSALEQTVKEQEGRLGALYQALMATDQQLRQFVDSVNELKKVSVDDVARTVANSRVVDPSKTRMEQDANQRNHAIFTDIHSQFAGLTKVGNEPPKA